ncbi:MAG: signal peptide peptidase SppA [Moheibacter sp.]
MKKFFGNVLTVIVGNFLTFTLIALVIGGLILVSSIPSLFESKGPKDGSVLELTLNSPIKESSMDDEVTLFPSSEPSVYFRDILLAIESAKEDDKIKGISLKIGNFNGGSTQLADIRSALEDFKSDGKFIYAYSHNSSQGGYILNSVADSVFQNPLGMVLAQGLSAEVMFFKNFGDKFGIDFQVIRHGEYKSAVEPYLREDLSPENREQLDLILNDIWSHMSQKVMASRNLTAEQWQTAVDSLYSFNPRKALQFKLVDKLVQETEYDQALADRLGLEVKEDESLQEVLDKHSISLDAYAATLKPETGKDHVAVLYASGAIMPGESFTGIQSETYKKTIRDLKEDDHVKAVVLRVNSPGGSADASEEILFELKELRKVKPVIVSFGDVAASGGYYIAMEADSIFAHPATITGSIGVLGMMPSVKKLVNDLGITTDYVNTNENSDFLKTPFKPLSPSGLQAMTEMTENVYTVFVQHVMQARNMSFEEVDAIGGGRVWSGVQAKKLGLVDAFGSLNDAIAVAAQKAGLDKYAVIDYPFRKGGFEEFMEQFQGVKTEAYVKEQLGNDYYNLYMELKAMREFNGIQTRLPFDIKIR